jgi:hypothetical protein
MFSLDFFGEIKVIKKKRIVQIVMRKVCAKRKVEILKNS